VLLRERTQPKENPTTFLVPVELENRDPELNATTKEVPTYGAMAVETLEDLMDAITSIVTIGMSGDPRTTVRHLSFTRFWADRLAALADREPNGVPFGILLRIDAREELRRGAHRNWIASIQPVQPSRSSHEACSLARHADGFGLRGRGVREQLASCTCSESRILLSSVRI
jgi:hypothetical protein